jgi:hypothetical protein
MRWFIVGGWILVGIAGLWLTDRLATWMEWNGWIYWRKSKGTSSRTGNAFLEIQSMFEPGKEHVIEARQEIKRQTQAAGDPPPG